MKCVFKAFELELTKEQLETVSSYVQSASFKHGCVAFQPRATQGIIKVSILYPGFTRKLQQMIRKERRKAGEMK